LSNVLLCKATGLEHDRTAAATHTPARPTVRRAPSATSESGTAMSARETREAPYENPSLHISSFVQAAV
jgi:hypothetical protein